MRRPFRSRCFGTCHFCIKTSRHGYKLHAIVCKLQELKLQYSVISYLSYHSFNILDDFPKSDITYFLFITVPSAVRHPPSAIRRPPSAVRIRRPHPHFTESPPRQHFGVSEDWRKFGNPQKNWRVFETGGRTYFTLLGDRFITYVNKIGENSL